MKLLDTFERDFTSIDITLRIIPESIVSLNNKIYDMIR